MSDSEYIKRDGGPSRGAGVPCPSPHTRKFVQNGSFGYGVSGDVVFQTLKTRYPEAYHAFGRERKVEVLERYARSPYIEGQRRTCPNNPDKDSYLRSLERLRYVMSSCSSWGTAAGRWLCSWSFQRCTLLASAAVLSTRLGSARLYPRSLRSRVDQDIWQGSSTAFLADLVERPWGIRGRFLLQVQEQDQVLGRVLV